MNFNEKHTVFSIVLVCFCLFVSGYEIGTGIGDVTGPAAEINMMGYAKMSQKSFGIHMRLFSRAFIVGEEGNPSSRVVFVSVDCGMISQNIKTKVSQKLREKYGNLYTEKNVVLSATHTHSGPGGFHQYLLFAITSLGFVEQSFYALVTGIVQSIDHAHSRLKKGRLFTSSGELKGTNINRSPTSYLRNPPEERQRYSGDTDETMTLIKFVAENGEEMGTINWFAVHGTSMNNTNGFISGDNKGYASQLFERSKNANWPHKVTFVAAFAQANEGDVSPNTAGPRCVDTGLPCEPLTSTCDGKASTCIAFGPGKDMFDSMKIIGSRQYKKAVELYASANTEIVGNVTFRHQYLDMSRQAVTLKDGSKVTTCPPAMGYSFAAGTTDGPGDFDFKQGLLSKNPLWSIVSGFLKRPSKQQVECHAPKPILLDTGEFTYPYKWQADIVETQILKIGQLYVIAVPGEFTTMSGRRLREAVLETAGQSKSKDIAVIAGLSNTYADYITTFEEYQAQRYEAASTIHGPHTLEAYIQQYKALTKSIFVNPNIPLDPGPSPPYMESNLICLVPKVIFDRPPITKSFGDVLVKPKRTYRAGETVMAKMISANPRNDLFQGSSFFDVERETEDSDWVTVFTDAHHETKFKWNRRSTLTGTSEVELIWNIPSDIDSGTYRLHHRGAYKKLFPFRKIKHFDAFTDSFHVTH